VLLYAITSRNRLPGTESERQAALLALARSWAHGGIDYIQIREKDLPPPDLLALTLHIVAAVHEEGPNTRILLSGQPQIALEAGADGVHLPSSAPAEAANEARQAFHRAGRDAIVSRACHSLEEVRRTSGVSLVVFAPVFEKAEDQETRPGVGLEVLKEMCEAAGSIPVIALGGVTTANAPKCLDAGAAGVAGIRLFLDDEWRELRSL
jgi:thiamine-phosphate pyrophosphorylase